MRPPRNCSTKVAIVPLLLFFPFFLLFIQVQSIFALLGISAWFSFLHSGLFLGASVLNGFPVAILLPFVFHYVMGYLLLRFL